MRTERRQQVRPVARLALELWLAACAYPSTEARWEKPGAGEADLESARELCMRRAESTPARRQSERLQAEARANAFVHCIEEQGWKRVPVEEDASDEP